MHSEIEAREHLIGRPHRVRPKRHVIVAQYPVLNRHQLKWVSTDEVTLQGIKNSNRCRLIGRNGRLTIGDVPGPDAGRADSMPR